MKKLLFAIVAMMMFSTSVPTMAQQRKTVKRSTTVKRNTNSTSKAKAPVSAQIRTTAIYSINNGIKSACVGKDGIYYLEKGDDNAVMKIDQLTGNVSTLIPGIANVYEGARPRINSIYACGNKLILDCGNMYNGGKGVFVYNGTNFNNFYKLSNKGNVIVANERYLVCECEEDGILLCWDVANLKIIKKFNRYNGEWSIPSYLDCMGNSWWREGLSACCHPLKGDRIYYSLENESYVKQVREGTARGGLDGKVIQKGCYLYFACGRRLYRMQMRSSNPTNKPVWEEYLVMPPTMNNTFDWYCVDDEGNVFTQGDSKEDYNTIYWKKGEHGEVKILGRDLLTGFDKWGYTKIWVNLNKNYADEFGNLISVGDSDIYIYNPNGIIDYSNVVGKIIEK